ncbi:tetratricopeptide repeat protein [Nesterenkonia marinintestina]|uniref:tetratricopeptide repeat protein n=1 Tax=Nesterenkonia marinintestina TaxID=2979865 RepID=UPI0021C0AE09|nr:tetratricopeptide repeat protein [Nesterenkonia sp. GX14115]
MTGESADPQVEMPGTAALATRLKALLHAPQVTEASAETARGWIDLAYEAAYGERYAAAADAARAGLRAPGAQDPENRLMLLRVLSGVHEMRGDPEAAAPVLTERLALLREMGRTRQARVEEDLGSMLLREPDSVEGEILARVAEELRSEDAETGSSGSLELADVLSSLAVRTLHDSGPESTLPLVRESCEILQAHRRQEALAGARMFLAHTLLLAGESEESLSVAESVLAGPANRAVRGAMQMLRATVHHGEDRTLEALDEAVAAAELYAASGVRRGSASAAALVAGLASGVDEDEAAVLAWRVAVQQAELGEFPEAAVLSLALGQQLLEIDEYREAEQVLDRIASRGAGQDDASTRGKALMGLGHAVAQQKRPTEALEHWREAAEIFLGDDEPDEAARAHLAAGALSASLDKLDAARRHYEMGLELAEQSDDDPAVLVQALHSLGHLLTREGEAEGTPHLERALSLARDHGTDWLVADITDSIARGLVAMGSGTQAVARALDAADLFRAAEDVRSGANSEIFAGKVLLQMGRADEAEAILRMAVSEVGGEHDLVAEALEARIDALMRQDKAEEAARLRRDLTRLKRRGEA